MMAEIKRVLRPEGLLIISSPDKKEYSVVPNYLNPFHVKELFKEEFGDLVQAYFKNVALLCQRIVYGSGIFPEAGVFRAINYDIKDISCACRGLARGRYLIAIACDEPLPILSGGLLEQPVEEAENVKSYAELAEKRSDVIRQLEQQVRSESAQLAEEVRLLEEQLRCDSAQSAEKVRLLEEQLCSQSVQSAEKVRRLEEQVSKLDLTRLEAEQLCHSMSTSVSWRLTLPLRVLRDRVVATLKKARHRDNLPLKDVLWSSKTAIKNDPGELLPTIFDATHYLKQVSSAAGSGTALEHYRTIGWREGYDPHPLFDVDWYLSENRDVAEAGMEPLQHYLERGWKEGRNPHPLFELKRYLAENADVAQAGVEPLSHYCKHGWHEGRDPHPLFDVDWYLSENRDVAEAGVEPLQHYLEKGWKEGRNFHPLFEPKRYLAENADVAQAGVEPLTHYCKHGWHEGRNPHPLFDVDWYLSENRDVAEAGVEPLQHYLERGWKEGRNPHTLFDLKWYLMENADVAQAGVEPLSHYCKGGWHERRDPHPLFDVDWYLSENRDVAGAGVEPLQHYLEQGWKEGRNPHPLFDLKWYLMENADVAQAGVEPLSHYCKDGWHDGNDPHPLFDVDWYLRKNGDVAEAVAEPLRHYLEYGWKEGRNPHPLFDVKRYLVEKADVVQGGVESSSHYCKHGWHEARDPHPLFDVDRYVSENRDVAEADAEPLQHYLEQGWEEGRNPHPLFDVKRYLAENAGVAQAGVEPLSHYCKDGWHEGRDPHPLFDVDWYLSENRDVREASTEPLSHYLERGWKEGRNPHPLFGIQWYLERNPDVRAAGLEPLSHYMDSGWREGRSPHPLFDAKCYLERNPAVAASGAEPLRHYVDSGCKDQRNDHPLYPLFDPAWYLQENPEIERGGMDPFRHYISRGWREGCCPSPLFDSVWYLKAYEDVANAGLEPLTHYLHNGISEGRFPRSVDKELAELQDQNFAKWAAEHCARFLSQTKERELSETVRKGVIKDLSDALAAARIDKMPDVSIVIPVHNKLDFTLISVTAVLMSNPLRSFEIILADDASTDETRAIFENLPKPVRYVRWDRNQGFLRTCNAAAERAHGKYLVFLNNDTIVFPGWLDSLIDTLEEQQDAGLVGSKLLFANGRLQEAGGIIWSDGGGMNFGRDDDPGHPRYNYLREVDYCSGCSIAISKELWSELCGFDEKFAPAYYGDTDLCFRARQRGKRIFYQPFSKLIHFEGITSGTSTSSGVKAHQELNRSRFLDRWSDPLQFHGNQDGLPRIADRYSGGHVLVVDAEVPTPDQDSGSITTLNFLRVLKRLKKRVTFVPSDLNRLQHYASQVEAIGVECLCHPTFSSLRDAISYVGPEIEFAFLHRVRVARPIIDFIKRAAPNAKIIFNTMDLHFLRERREADLFGGRWRQDRAERTRLDEFEVIRKADATIVLNDSERVLLNGVVPSATVFQIGLVGLPNYSPLVANPTLNARRDIVFVGGFRHPPNCDAVRYFVCEVWPILRGMGYRDRFIIVGSNMPREIESLGSDQIVARGYVEDLLEVFSSARISVAPLRFGAGLKGKIAASLGYGVPCVTTSIGVEGSGLLDGVNVLVGDNSDDLASDIMRVYNDDQLWTKLSQNGLHFFRENYSLEVLGAKIESLMTVVNAEPLESNER